MERKKYMNPYLAGFGLGLVLLAAFYFSAEGLGGSGAPKRIVVAAVAAVAPHHAYANEYDNGYLNNGQTNPLSNWVVFEVLGVLVGGFISGAISGRLKFVTEHSPKITSKKRLWMALIGGTLFGIGSQFGRGCTSGAALSGMVVFSVAGYIALIGIFATAFVVGKFIKNLYI
jgi:uncharacterized membrane protein YedE/YeeE